MATPLKGYFLGGTRIPSTTTIIGRFKDSSGLMPWAFNQGMKKGLAGEATAKLYDDTSAVDIGTAAHAMVEARIKNPDADVILVGAGMLPDADMLEKAKSSFSAYEAWARNFKVEIIAQEIQLVSEKYKYGGTPDAIGRIGKDIILIDFKTSNGVYQDYLIQLAAYKSLWEENHPDQPITGGCHLLRFAKEHGDFAHHYYPNLDNAWRQFVLFREAYEIDKELKKRAA